MSRRVRRSLVGAVLAAALAVGVAPAAQATVVHVGGGTWNYGVESIFPSWNWSDYYHPSRRHRSSVTGDQGLIRSRCTAPGQWSRVRAWDSNPFRIDHAYWSYC